MTGGSKTLPGSAKISSVIGRLQEHTVKIYDLNNKKVTEGRVEAKQLLHPSRFDLFAKMYYIRNFQQNKESAEKVYREHIKAFNPDWTEPGNEAKSGYEVFLSEFNRLIFHFQTNEFDPDRSLVPLADENILLDGAHRVATLAYYGKQVNVAFCENTTPKTDFNYDYFRKRGLSWDTMDLIANEMALCLPNLYVACLWPRTSDKSKAVSLIKSNFYIAYEKTLKVSFQSLRKFISIIYLGQPWTNNSTALTDMAMQCYGINRKLLLIFFTASDIDDVISLKKEIRKIYGTGKHSVHITDTIKETRAIANCSLIAGERIKWQGRSIGNTLFKEYEESVFYIKFIFLNKLKTHLAKVWQSVRKKSI